MNTLLPPPKLHPAVLAAALSVSALALAGIGVLTGALPFAPKAAEAPPAAEQAIPATPAAVVTPAAKASSAVQRPVSARATPAKTQGGPDIEVIRKGSDGLLRTADAEPVPAAPLPCHDCGTIESVREIAREGEASGLGAAAGGVVGGILGRQIGNGSGRDIATVLGAIGGAVAGHQIEKTQKKSVQYEVVVRFEDGTSRVLTEDAPPAWRQGDKVKFANGVLVAN